MISSGFSRGNPVAHWHSIDALTGGPVSPQAQVASFAWPSANMAIYVPVLVRRAVVVTKLWVPTNTTGTGNIDLGLYSASGTKLVSSGSTAKSTSRDEQIINVTDTTIVAGLYYIALASDSGTDTFYGYSVSPPGATALGIYTEASAFTLPASATFALAQTLSTIPAVGMLLNTLAS